MSSWQFSADPSGALFTSRQPLQAAPSSPSLHRPVSRSVFPSLLRFVSLSPGWGWHAEQRSVWCAWGGSSRKKNTLLQNCPCAAKTPQMLTEIWAGNQTDFHSFTILKIKNKKPKPKKPDMLCLLVLSGLRVKVNKMKMKITKWTNDFLYSLRTKSSPGHLCHYSFILREKFLFDVRPIEEKETEKRVSGATRCFFSRRKPRSRDKLVGTTQPNTDSSDFY